MKLFVLAGTALLFSLLATGQQLTMYPSFGGAHFEYQKDTIVYQVSPKQVSQILYDDPTAHAEFKKARLNSTIAGIMGFVGAGLLIIPAATAVTGGEPEWELAAGGAALIIGSIPISTSYKRRAQKAIDMYNKKHTAFRPRAEYFFSGIGVRLVLRF